METEKPVNPSTHSLLSIHLSIRMSVLSSIHPSFPPIHQSIHPTHSSKVHLLYRVNLGPNDVRPTLSVVLDFLLV